MHMEYREDLNVARETEQWILQNCSGVTASAYQLQLLEVHAQVFICQEVEFHTEWSLEDGVPQLFSSKIRENSYSF